MKINKNSKFKVMRKDGKGIQLFFKSTKQIKDEVNDDLVRDFEDKKYEVDLNGINCKENFEQRIIETNYNDDKFFLSYVHSW